MEDQVSVYMSPSDRAAQLFPKVSGSLFVALYGSLVYGGGILTRFHTDSMVMMMIIWLN
jgi:hypothetical protein